MAASLGYQVLWDASEPVLGRGPPSTLTRQAQARRLGAAARLCGNALRVAGSLNLKAKAWARLARHSGTVRLWLSRGAQIKFLTPIRKFTLLENPKLSPDQREQVTAELRKAVEQGAVESCSREDVVLVSPIFLVPKKNGKVRLVHDLRHLNARLPKPPKFKLDGLRDLPFLAERGDVGATLDMSSGYHQLLMATHMLPYLGVRWEGQYYRFRVLPFGLSWAPFIFHKVMRQFVASLRAQGVRVLNYLDDFLVLARDAREMAAVRRRVERQAEHFGVRFSAEKCDWTPRTHLEWLGTLINLEDLSVGVTTEKKDQARKFVGDLLRISRSRPVPRRLLASAVGTLGWATFCVPAVQLYLRSAHEVLRRTGPGLWSRAVWLPPDLQADLRTALQRVLQAPTRPIQAWAEEATLEVKAQPTSAALPAEDVWSDSSDFRWGAVLMAGGARRVARDVFARSSQALHINEKELWAVLYALKSFAPSLRGRRVRLHIDNTTALCYVRNFGGRVPRLTAVARQIWEFAWAHQMDLCPVWVPSAENPADEPSREPGPCAKNEWQLSPRVFEYLCRQWGTPAVDRFASSGNTQLPRFNSWGPDPLAEAENGLAQDWRGVLNYANPPWPLIPRVLRLVEQQRASVVLVVPWWPSAVWWPLLQRLAADRRHFAPAPDLFRSGRTAYRDPAPPPRWGVGAFLLRP